MHYAPLEGAPAPENFERHPEDYKEIPLSTWQRFFQENEQFLKKEWKSLNVADKTWRRSDAEAFCAYFIIEDESVERVSERVGMSILVSS